MSIRAEIHGKLNFHCMTVYRTIVMMFESIEAARTYARANLGRPLPDKPPQLNHKIYKVTVDGTDVLATQDADLRGADLTGANLEGATLSGANSSGANLDGAMGYEPEDLFRARV